MSRLPVLTAATMKNEEAVGDAIDGMLLGSKAHRQLTKKVLRAQGRLQRAVDEQTWRLYLRLEEIVNERADFHMKLLVTWAFRQGCRRSRRQRA
jgi:hypothetical protein